MSDQVRQQALQEVALLKALVHPGIVGYRTCFIQDDSLHIVRAREAGAAGRPPRPHSLRFVPCGSAF